MGDSTEWVYYPIQGVPVKSVAAAELGPTVKVPIRQNIDQWSSDPANDKQVKLFVMALDQFQKISPQDRDSYFQIAGIHGQPNVPWDEPLDPADAKGRGYCTHNNILFPVWHRAYLALYEQRLFEIMTQKIIPNFPRAQRPVWEEAANAWRLPFWDWGVSSSVPALSKYPTTLVPTKDGKSEESISNPLFQFRMPTNKPMSTAGMDNFKDPWVDDGDMLYYGECIGTSRWPEKDDAVSGSASWKYGVVNNYKVQDALTKPPWVGDTDYGQAAEMVYRLLTVPMEYSTFATTAQLSKDQDVASDVNIEYLHNNVHGWVGGDYNGHMSQIPVATFDPLFWLHHCNIDRIFALWQGLNPGKWFEAGQANDFFQETIGLPPGAPISPKTELRPFHKDTKGTVFTPDDVRWPYTLGYSYPELQTWKEAYGPNAYSSETFLDDLRKSINQLYGVSRKALLDAASNLKGVEYFDDGVKSLDYAFSIRYFKYAFGGEPFWIRIYLSQDDAGTRNAHTDLITEVFNFSQKPEEKSGKLACSNCKTNKEQNIRSTANISITPVLVTLLKAGKDLGSLSRENVLDFIQKRAYWRVFRGGKEVPRYELDPLDLEIIGSTNDATNYNDPRKAPLLENFQPEPSISGGADGALAPNLKQPMTVPPPLKIDVPKAALPINSFLSFKEDLSDDSVVIIDSVSLNLSPGESTAGGIDNTQFWFSDSETGDGNILFLLSIRRAEHQIVFNTCFNNTWGTEVRVPLDERFRDTQPSILIHDQGDGYEVFIDWRHLAWLKKKDRSKVARSISYTVNDGFSSVWASELKVKVFASMKEVFQR
ncbi:hypothetical protein BJX99DRAFT_270192 [Aspergillus californicus]